MTNEEKILAVLEKQGKLLEKLDQRMDSIDQRMDSMDQRMDSMDQRQTRTEELLEQMQSDVSGIKVRLDVEVRDRFNLLAENQQIMLEKLERLDDMEVMDTRITALEAMVKKLNREMEKLKKAQ